MWGLFGESCQGGTHQRRNLPCQDANAWAQSAGWRVAVVADGHGSRRHFRSQTGARFACDVALECITAMLQEGDQGVPPDEERIARLKEDMLRLWRARVQEHAARHIWTLCELVEQIQLLSPEQYQALVDGDNPLVPYGSTLAAVFCTDTYWGAVQLGDGDTVLIDRNGSFCWPMPESQVNMGRFTASLCMKNPMEDFRHCLGTSLPAVMLAYTDGVEKAFPPHGEQLATFLHSIWTLAHNGSDSGLRQRLRGLAEQGPVQDDTTMAGLIDISVKVTQPQLSAIRRQEDMSHLRTTMEECRNAIAYNTAQLERINRDDPAMAAAAAQMERIVAKRKQQLTELMDLEQRLCAQQQMVEQTMDDSPADLNDAFACTPTELTWAAPENPSCHRIEVQDDTDSH